MDDIKKPRGRPKEEPKPEKIKTRDAHPGAGKPKGHPQRDREELLTRKIDAGLISRYLTLNSHLTLKELQHRLKFEEISILEGMTIKGLIMAYKSGNYSQINFFYERLIGKVPNKIEHSVENPLDKLSDAELIAKKRELEETNRRTLRFIEASSASVTNLEQEALAIVEASNREAETGHKDPSGV